MTIAAAKERPRLRSLGRLTATSLRCCETSEIVADFPTRRESSLGALPMSPTVGGGVASDVERCTARLSALSTMSRLWWRSRPSSALPKSSISRVISATRRRSSVSRTPGRGSGDELPLVCRSSSSGISRHVFIGESSRADAGPQIGPGQPPAMTVAAQVKGRPYAGCPSVGLL